MQNKEARVRNFRDIKAWKKAHELVLSVYEATRTFPPDERYGLITQARRAAASIPANIAEGCGRDGEVELARFFQIAMVRRVSLSTTCCSHMTLVS